MIERLYTSGEWLNLNKEFYSTISTSQIFGNKKFNGSTWEYSQSALTCLKHR